jgi:hypothetical protein
MKDLKNELILNIFKEEDKNNDDHEKDQPFSLKKIKV